MVEFKTGNRVTSIEFFLSLEVDSIEGRYIMSLFLMGDFRLLFNSKH